MWNSITQSLTALVSFSFMIVLLTATVKRGVSVPYAMFVLSAVLLISNGLWAWGEGLRWPAWKLAIPLLIAAGICSVLGNWAMFLATSTSANAGYAVAIIGCQAALVVLLSYWFLGGELHWLRLVGIAVCFVGVMLISWPIAKVVP